MHVFSLSQKPFNLDSTLASGQAFRWKKSGGKWSGWADDAPAECWIDEGKLYVESNAKKNKKFFENYFGLEHDLHATYAALSHDSHLRSLFNKHNGLRLMNQNPWQCLVSFVLSQQSTIPLIEKRVAWLCDKYGEGAFPSPEQLAESSEEELREAKFGYRSKYLPQLAKQAVENPAWVKEVKNMGLSQAREYLTEFTGVGEKIADCVLLYGLGFKQAFPIDTHILQVLQEKYALKDLNYRRLTQFALDRFGEHAGYAQQYLFYNHLVSSKQQP